MLVAGALLVRDNRTHEVHASELKIFMFLQASCQSRSLFLAAPLQSPWHQRLYDSSRLDLAPLASNGSHRPRLWRIQLL